LGAGQICFPEQSTMLRLLFVALVSLASLVWAGMAVAGQHRDEFVDAKARLFFLPQMKDMMPGVKSESRRQMILGLASNSRWADLGYYAGGPEDEQVFQKKCAEGYTVFSDISDYTLSVERAFGGDTIKDELILDHGLQYHVRRDFRRYLDMYKRQLGEHMPDALVAKTLRTADGKVTMLALSQNVLLTIDDDGIPVRLGRCPAADASPSSEEFKSSGELLFPDKLNPKSMSTGDRDQVDVRRADWLIGRIEGAWIDLDRGDVSSEENIAAQCSKRPIGFERLNAFGFARKITTAQAADGAQTQSVEATYLFRDGISYSMRLNVDAIIAGHDDKQGGQSETKIYDAARFSLPRASQVSNLVLVSPNVLLETNNGDEHLYGRCEP
jgi:hypothetical protein